MESVWDGRLRSTKNKDALDYDPRRAAVLTLLDSFDKYCQLTIEEAIEQAKKLEIEETNHHVVFDIKLERTLGTLQQHALKRWEEHAGKKTL